MTKEESNCIKGISIILMFWHHLFGCKNFLINNAQQLWISSASGYETVIGRSGKICISLFCAISGYGLYKSYLCVKDSRIVKRWISFLTEYWTILFLVAIPYLIFFGKFNPDYLFMNLFALLHDDQMLYLSLSWYVKVYLEILIVLPLVKIVSGFFRKHFGRNLLIEILVHIIIPLQIAQILPFSETIYIDFRTNLLSSVGLLAVYYPIFYSGVMLAEYQVFEKLKTGAEKAGKISTLLGFLSCFLAHALCFHWSRSNTFTLYNILIVSILYLLVLLYMLCISNVILHENYSRFLKKATSIIRSLLSGLGKYSFQLWLLSGMFFLNTQEFSYILYLPKYPLLIICWNFILLFPFAFIMKKISVYISPLPRR